MIQNELYRTVAGVSCLPAKNHPIPSRPGRSWFIPGPAKRLFPGGVG